MLVGTHHRWFFAVLCILMCAMLFGCGTAKSSIASQSSGSTSAPTATLSPTSYTFSSQVLNSTSTAAAFTLTNDGNASLTLSSIGISGGFAQTNTCGSSLVAGAKCTIKVAFTPTTAGNYTGTLSIADNAAGSPQQIALSGAGVSIGQLVDSPTGISFGSLTVGQTASRSVTITNPGGQTISITSVSTSGAGVGVTGISTPLVLSQNQSSTFNVTFAPSSAGAVSGNVYLTNNGSVTSVTIPVTGTGTTAASHEVVLEWTASSSAVLGYNTYRSTVSGGPYAKLTASPSPATIYDDQNVQAGDTYYYVVTSVGTDSVESGYSNQASATVPSS